MGRIRKNVANITAVILFLAAGYGVWDYTGRLVEKPEKPPAVVQQEPARGNVLYLDILTAGTNPAVTRKDGPADVQSAPVEAGPAEKEVAPATQAVPQQPAVDTTTQEQFGRCVDVYDGDTITVRLYSSPKELINVRLIGVDAPELKKAITNKKFGGISMALNLVDLDARTRQLMLEELLIDIEKNALYLSKRLNNVGLVKYPEILRRSISMGNDVTLANELKGGYMNPTEQKKKPKGGYTIARVPANAHEMLAEGEFNRFYLRALCQRAIEEGRILVIYRAKSVMNPRAESEIKIGQTVDPIRLLEDLRTNIGIDTALGIPAGPNSGLSVRLA